MPSRQLDRFSRTVGVGLRAAELWFVVSLLVLDWLASTAGHLGTPSIGTVVLGGAGNLVAIAGALLLARPASGALRPLQLVGSAVLLIGGYVITFSLLPPAQQTDTTTAVVELSLFKFAVIGAMVLTGPGLLPVALAPAMLLLIGVVTSAVGRMHGYVWAYDGYATAVTAMVIMVTVGTVAARRIGGAARRQVDALLDEESAQGRLTEAQAQSSVTLQDSLVNDLAVLATLGPGPLPGRLGTSLREALDLMTSPDRRKHGAGTPSAATSSGVQRAIDDAVGGGLVVRVIGEIATLESLDSTTGHALGLAVERCLTNTIQHAATDEAEITVLSDEGEDELSIMVVESGTGTDHDGEDDSDGLRTAVEERIEQVGGTVLVFSRAGVGTTVLLTVPRDSPLVGSGR